MASTREMSFTAVGKTEMTDRDINHIIEKIVDHETSYIFEKWYNNDKMSKWQKEHRDQLHDIVQKRNAKKWQAKLSGIKAINAIEPGIRKTVRVLKDKCYEITASSDGDENRQLYILFDKPYVFDPPLPEGNGFCMLVDKKPDGCLRTGIFLNKGEPVTLGRELLLSWAKSLVHATDCCVC